ncbi:MAG: squalene/phytoene synthase family protein [Chloroflexota bacterium]
MSVDSLSWERHLELRAIHALNNQTPNHPIDFDKNTLADAHDHCYAVTQQHSKTFFMASQLLPSEQRQAARALYAFCRESDDLIDNGGKNRLRRLVLWKHESLSNDPKPHNKVALAWSDARTKYQIPRQYAEQLLDGVALDLTKNRFEDFQELAHYCYGVASTVGLMTMHIVGYESERAIPYAIKLGVALQLTNILRDIQEDWQNGRLYLPQDELKGFGLTEADIENQVNDARWRAFMQFQIERNRRLYDEALPGIQMLGKSGRFAIAAAADLYKGILDNIEAHGYDVFSRRAHLTSAEKLKRLPAIWMRTRFNRYGRKTKKRAQQEISRVAWQ